MEGSGGVILLVDVVVVGVFVRNALNLKPHASDATRTDRKFDSPFVP